VSIEGNPFSRAAYFIGDWIDMTEECVRGEDPNGDFGKKWFAQIAEARQVRAHMETLAGQFERARKHRGAEQAAQIVAGMLADFGLVGSVWYSPKGRRFRLTGDGHEPGPAEVFVGAYLPDCDAAMLAEDFAAVLGEQSMKAELFE